jgi:hypothetical protein
VKSRWSPQEAQGLSSLDLLVYQSRLLGAEASLVLFGGFATLDIVLSELFEGITRRGVFEILSPFSALAKQAEWLFGIEVVGADFPAWWGLVEWVLLTVVGWALVAWRYPRVAGEGR